MNQTFEFTKMHGLGNCYIYLDGVSGELDLSDYPELARQVSDPSCGIGSDGLILILPSSHAEIQMRIFNKDGSEAKNCGNGLRCVAKFAYEHHLVEQEQFSIATLSGNKRATVHPEKDGSVHRVTIDMGAPFLQRQQIPVAGGSPDALVIDENLQIGDYSYSFTAVSMGNPHALFFVDSVDRAPISTLGPLLADTYPLFPEGANIGFVHPLSNGALDYRVWERGSGITQACGTGACAAVVASILKGYAEKDQRVTVHLAGGDLTIRWESNSGHVFMTGNAETICTGIFFCPETVKMAR